MSAFPSPMVSRIRNTGLIPFLGHDGYLHKKEHPVLHEEHGCARARQQINEAFPTRAKHEEVVEV